MKQVTELPLRKAVREAMGLEDEDMSRPAPGVQIKVVTPEPAYTRESLEGAIRECDRHIELLEASIDEANQRKKELKRLLRELEG